jgi:hypothetical protein
MMRLSCLVILLGVFTFASPDLIAADINDHVASAAEMVPDSVPPQPNQDKFAPEDVSILTEEQHQAYKRDKPRIQMHKQTLLALHASMGSQLTWELPCKHDWWMWECWNDFVKKKVEEAAKFTLELNKKVLEVRDLANQLAQIKPVMEQLAGCLNTLPGAMPLDQTLTQLGGALGQNDLLGWADRTYVQPLIKRTTENWNGTIGILTEFTHNKVEIFQNGELNAEAIGKLPKQLLQMGFDIIRLDATGRCFMDSAIMKDFMALADVPIFEQMFTETLKALNELWKHVQPVFDGVISFITEQIKPLITDLLAPMLNDLDNTASNTINQVFTQQASELLSNVRNETGKADRDLLCKMQDLGSSLITQPEITLKAIFKAVLSDAGKQVTKFLNKELFQPLLNHVIWLVTQAQGGLMQVLVGLCGLIPEVGGLICSAITKPLSDLMSWAVAELSSKTVGGLVSIIDGWLDSEIPYWAEAISKPLADLIKQGKAFVTDSVAQIPIPTHPRDVVDSETAVFMKGMAPVVAAIEPFLIDAAKAVFPRISLEMEKAQNHIHTLTRVVKYNLCTDGNVNAIDPDTTYTYPPYGPKHPPGF